VLCFRHTLAQTNYVHLTSLHTINTYMKKQHSCVEGVILMSHVVHAVQPLLKIPADHPYALCSAAHFNPHR
jgi:hypothetical protein